MAVEFLEVLLLVAKGLWMEAALILDGFLSTRDLELCICVPAVTVDAVCTSLDALAVTGVDLWRWYGIGILLGLVRWMSATAT